MAVESVIKQSQDDGVDEIIWKISPIHENAPPSLGILLSSNCIEMTLNASSLFIPNPDVPFIDFSGKTWIKDKF